MAARPKVGGLGSPVPCPELAGCVLSQFVLIFVMKTNGFLLVHDCTSASHVASIKVL